MAKKCIQTSKGEFAISYSIIDNKKEEWIVFLHGWGSNKEALSGCFGKYFVGFNHLYIDLPGFGNSNNEYVLDTMDYCRIINQFLHSLNISPSHIVGHSFGGKIATLLNPKNLILLSSAGLQKPKSISVKLKIIMAKILKLLGIKSSIFRTKDANNLSENMYKTLKNVVNEDFSAIFKDFDNKAFIFWGKGDNITPLFLGERIHSLIKDSTLYPLEGDHFFFLKHNETIDRIVNGNK